MFSPVELVCSRVWDEHGHFYIAVKWEFDNGTDTSHIFRYVVTPTLQVGSWEDNNRRLFDQMLVQPQVRGATSCYSMPSFGLSQNPN